MKKKVLVLGSSGLIGHQIYLELLDKNYPLKGISLNNKIFDSSILLDVREFDNFKKFVKRENPDVIINCIGLLISESEKLPEKSIYLNSLFPHKLKELCNHISSKLIHISTDCVFSGNNKNPYKENDVKNGIGIYSKTKSLGEIITKNHLTIRTSVVGPEISNRNEELFNWFINQKVKIFGYKKSIWSGVTTYELARSIPLFIENNITGLYHLTNNKTIDKYSLLNLFKRFTNKKIQIDEIDGNNIDRSFIDTRNELQLNLPDYETMIDNMIINIKKNKLYSHYKF